MFATCAPVRERCRGAAKCDAQEHATYRPTRMYQLAGCCGHCGQLAGSAPTLSVTSPSNAWPARTCPTQRVVGALAWRADRPAHSRAHPHRLHKSAAMSPSRPRPATGKAPGVSENALSPKRQCLIADLLRIEVAWRDPGYPWTSPGFVESGCCSRCSCAQPKVVHRLFRARSRTCPRARGRRGRRRRDRPRTRPGSASPASSAAGSGYRSPRCTRRMYWAALVGVVDHAGRRASARDGPSAAHRRRASARM
jgi:hypothetical protein